MMTFNCPRNFKKGRLIANRFRWIDLIIAGSGITVSVVSIMLYISVTHGAAPLVIGALLLPGIICFILVSPAGIYHNVLEFIIVVVHYIRSIRVFTYGGVFKHDTIEKNYTQTDDEE